MLFRCEYSGTKIIIIIEKEKLYFKLGNGIKRKTKLPALKGDQHFTNRLKTFLNLLDYIIFCVEKI